LVPIRLTNWQQWAPDVDYRDFPLSISAALRKTEQILADTSDTASLDARVLMEHVTGLSHADLISKGEQPLTESQQSLFDELVALRKTGAPVAYIIGHREFWSMDFLVTPDTLIPRPETETLVERALLHIPEETEVTIADLGTGSGAIALAIGYERPHAKVVATDASRLALETARVNEERLGLGNIELRLGSWLEPIEDFACDVIVSNPPYVRMDDPHLEKGDVRYEPVTALVSGDDGLDAIREIVGSAPAHLKPGGWLLLEHGFDQAADVKQLMKEAGFTKIETIGDLSGQDRVTEGSLNPD
jgi:release factor glutamine methyltransferase